MGIQDFSETSLCMISVCHEENSSSENIRIYPQVKYYGNVTSLPWDSILQGNMRCMFMEMVVTWKVLRKAQEDDVYMGKRGCEVSVVSMD